MNLTEQLMNQNPVVQDDSDILTQLFVLFFIDDRHYLT